jgi:hypothetical protein
MPPEADECLITSWTFVQLGRFLGTFKGRIGAAGKVRAWWLSYDLLVISMCQVP